MWKWQKKILVLSRRITGKWHLVWGIKEAGPAERWSGTAGAISVFGYQWEVVRPQFHKQFSPAVSAKETFLSSPILTTCFIPCAPFLPCAWHKCLCSHAVQPAGELVQAKITLLLSLSPLVPLTLVSPPGVRGEQNWLFWQWCQLRIFMKSLFQTACYSQTRENAILLTATKVGRQTNVPCYTATNTIMDCSGRKCPYFHFPRKEKHMEGHQSWKTLETLQNREASPVPVTCAYKHRIALPEQ